MNSSDKWLFFWTLLLLIILTGITSYFLFFGQISFPLSLNIVQRENRKFRKIEGAFNIGEYNKAISLASDFITEFPESKYKFKAIIIIAKSFFNKKEYSLSEKYAQSILGDSHVDLDSYVDAAIVSGSVYREYEKFNPVILHYLEDAYIKAEANKKLSLSTFIGYQYLYKKEYQTALKFFNESSGEEGIIGRARVYIEQGNYPGAIQEYINYFNAYPKNDRFERVKTAFLKQTFYYADFLRKKKDYKAALKYYMTVVNYFPKEKEADEAFVKMGEIYEENHDYKSALIYLDRALNNSVTNADEVALYNKAKIYYEAKRPRESLSYFREFQSKFPSSTLSKQVSEWIDIIIKEMKI